MINIACLTQRPIQTLILIYLLGEKNYKFDLIIYSPITKKNQIGSYHENDSSFETLKYQCKILNIPIKKVPNFNSKRILNLSKKFNIDAAISLVTDTILKKKILNSFPKGVFMTHGGILPFFRGVDANKWSYLEKYKFVGITLIKLSKGIDDGDILYVKKLPIKNRNLKELEKQLFYKYKLYLYKKIFIKLKEKKIIKLQRQKKLYPQYFKMHKLLDKLIIRN